MIDTFDADEAIDVLFISGGDSPSRRMELQNQYDVALKNNLFIVEE